MRKLFNTLKNYFRVRMYIYSQKITPVVTPVDEYDYLSEIESVSYDLTLIVDKDNNLQVIDNTVEDAKHHVDCGTIIYKQIYLEVR